MLQLLPIIEVLAAFIGNMVNVTIATPENHHQPSVNTASTQRQHSVNTASTQRQHSVNRVSTQCQQSVNNFRCCVLCNPKAVLWHLPIIELLATVRGNIVKVDFATPKHERHQSINRASTILGIASSIIIELCYGIYL